MEQEFPFPFPLEVPTPEDYGETDVMILKGYYLDTFKRLLNSFGKQKRFKIFCDIQTLQLLSFLTSDFQIGDKSRIEKYEINNEINNKTFQFKVNEIPIFFIRPLIQYVDICINFFYKYNNKNQLGSLEVVFVPGQNYEITQHLRNIPIEIFHIQNFYIDLIPLNHDLITLSQNNSLRELFLENNNTILNYFAEAIVKLESCYGKIQSYYLIGEKSKILKNLIERNEEEDNLNPNFGKIFSSIIIDRSCDYITPLCTNFTFEGAFDEYFGLNFGKVLSKENLLKEGFRKGKEPNNLVLNEYPFTLCYPQIRSMHIIHANIYIDKKLKYFFDIVQKGKNLNELAGLKEFGKINILEVLKERDSTNMCLNIANYIDKQRKNFKVLSLIEKEQILLAGELPSNLHNIYDQMICKKRDIYDLLRLMILENLTQDGILNYKEIKRDLINIYGYEKIFLLNNLEKINLLKEKYTSMFGKTSSNIYNTIVNKFQLINDNFDFDKIDDCSYVLGGYCPFTLKIIEAFSKGGWKIYNDAFKSTGFYFDYPQNESEIFMNKKEKNIVFVLFIGGITYNEIAGIRFLNMINKDLKFIIVTTNILNTKNTISQFDNVVRKNFSIKKFYQDFENMKKKK